MGRLHGLTGHTWLRSCLFAVGLAALLSARALSVSAPPNDNFGNANVISSLRYSDLGVNVTLATTETGEPNPSRECGHGFCFYHTVWYNSVASATTTLSASVPPTSLTGNVLRPFVAAYD